MPRKFSILTCSSLLIRTPEFSFQLIMLCLCFFFFSPPVFSHGAFLAVGFSLFIHLDPCFATRFCIWAFRARPNVEPTRIRISSVRHFLCYVNSLIFLDFEGIKLNDNGVTCWGAKYQILNKVAGNGKIMNCF